MTRSIEESKAKLDEFQALCDPLIKWLNDNHHPHMSILIDTESAQLLEGQMAYFNRSFIRD